MTALLLTFADTMKNLGGVALAVVILLVMVTIHELGHYIAGRILGFKINEFAVGFGPAIFKKRSKKTGELFALRVIPLGGYCAFDGEDEIDEPTVEKAEETPAEEPFEEMRSSTAENANEGGMVATTEENAAVDGAETADEYPEPKGERFNDQAPWKRIIVLIAGATMNYLLAMVFLFIMVGVYGIPKCIAMPIDYQSGATVESAEWANPYLAERDILLKIDGKKIGVISDCIDALDGKKAGEGVPVSILRKTEDGWKEKEVTLILQTDADFANMADLAPLETAMGVEIYTTMLKQGFWQTVGGAFSYSVDLGTTVIRSLGELLTGKLGLDAMGGPVTTITVTAQAATASAFSFLHIAAFIGVNLAVFNLLPIPALDGCKVIFCLIEWIRKKPVNRKVEAIIHFAGIIFLFGFAILVDLLQLF